MKIFEVYGALIFDMREISLDNKIFCDADIIYAVSIDQS